MDVLNQLVETFAPGLKQSDRAPSRRALAIWKQVDKFDEAVARQVDRRRSAGSDRFFSALSSAADHSLLWFTVGTVRGAVSRRHAGFPMGLYASQIVQSGLVNGALKPLFNRPRPEGFQDDLQMGMHRPITSSFPSGHAASAFSAAVVLADDDPLAPFYYALAALVAYSRVHTRMHHASDVLVGSVIGLGLGFASRAAIHKVQQLQQRREPQGTLTLPA
ncbi:MAG: phosphatase PAP2 family protein [Acidimicrobiia bacterium]|jgi:undecaprenyl-diphosphatase|nr:phosphatase PAP2 family protein [Acidimicrobiia bacterium]MBP8179779.1 phosphatase PAP2 family protein [Acidimicrobiia bacterium]